MIQFTIKPFDELTTLELYQIMQLREKVFVVEQNCVYLDADGKDLKSWHLLLTDKGNLLAYLRILPPGISYVSPSIGRVVVDPKYRQLEYGKEIMRRAIEFLNDKYPNQSIEIGAQVYLNNFYCNLGFKNNSEEYLEDGIPHVDMILI